jgi:hypothetical protein
LRTIDNAGRLDCTVWGGIMSRVAASRGVAGTVVFGACRDVATSEEVGYALWSAGRFMRPGKDRVCCAAVQVPIVIGDVKVVPGDYRHADADGVVAVPAGHVDTVLDLAERIEDVEDHIVDLAISGSTLIEVRRQRATSARISHSAEPELAMNVLATEHTSATLLEASGLDVTWTPLSRRSGMALGLPGRRSRFRGSAATILRWTMPFGIVRRGTCWSSAADRSATGVRYSRLRPSPEGSPDSSSTAVCAIASSQKNWDSPSSHAAWRSAAPARRSRESWAAPPGWAASE